MPASRRAPRADLQGLGVFCVIGNPAGCACLCRPWWRWCLRRRWWTTAASRRAPRASLQGLSAYCVTGHPVELCCCQGQSGTIWRAQRGTNPRAWQHILLLGMQMELRGMHLNVRLTMYLARQGGSKLGCD